MPVLRPLFLSAIVVWAQGACAAEEVDVAAAVGRLRSRTSDDAFLVIAEERTNKYVQFAKAGGSLIFDFPVSVLLKPGTRGSKSGSTSP